MKTHYFVFPPKVVFYNICRNKIPNRRSTERLVIICWKIGSVANTIKAHSGQPNSAKTRNNIQNFWELIVESPRKLTCYLSHKVLTKALSCVILNDQIQ